MNAAGPDPSDAATGLPPLEDVEPEIALLAVKAAYGEGVVTIPFTDGTTAVRYLSFRGLVQGVAPSGVEWAQVHIAIPVADVQAIIDALQETL